MTKLLAFLSPFVVLLVWASMASALSQDYCAYSLGGGGSLAPDNDYYAGRRHIETNYAVNIVDAYNTGWTMGAQGDWRSVQRVYRAATGQRYYTQLTCWLEYPGNIYHDAFQGVKYISGN